MPIRAEVRSIDTLSAHTDQGEILSWLRRFPLPPKRTFLVHGEPLASETVRESDASSKNRTRQRLLIDLIRSHRGTPFAYLTPGDNFTPRRKLMEELILLIRGERVIVDADLARIYGVTTKRLNEQVKRNRTRFPEDFMFTLTAEQNRQLVANCDRFKNLKYSSSLPSVFTEHGAIMRRIWF